MPDHNEVQLPDEANARYMPVHDEVHSDKANARNVPDNVIELYDDVQHPNEANEVYDEVQLPDASANVVYEVMQRPGKAAESGDCHEVGKISFHHLTASPRRFDKHPGYDDTEIVACSSAGRSNINNST